MFEGFLYIKDPFIPNYLSLKNDKNMIIRNAYFIAAIVIVFTHLGNAQDTTAVDSIYQLPIIKIEIEDKRANFMLVEPGGFAGQPNHFDESGKLFIEWDKYLPEERTKVYIYAPKWYSYSEEEGLFLVTSGFGQLAKIDSFPFDLRNAYVFKSNKGQAPINFTIDTILIDGYKNGILYLKYGPGTQRGKAIKPKKTWKTKLYRMINGSKTEFAIKITNFGMSSIKVLK